MSNFSDAALITRILLDDDRNAFGELVRRYQSDIRALLRKLCCGDHDSADDIAQETFIRAYRHLKTFRGGARFSTWLYRIAYNAFLSSVRKPKLQTSDSDFSDIIDISQSKKIENKLLRIDIEKAMKYLTENERLIISLYYSKNMTHEEIADFLKIPIGTVKTHLLRGKSKLKEKLITLTNMEAV